MGLSLAIICGKKGKPIASIIRFLKKVLLY